MDTFVEQIVLKKKGSREISLIASVIMGAFLIIALLVLFLLPYIGGLLLLVILGMGYGIWWVITSQNIEFEYSITNGDIDIDQIIAQRKRKRIVSVSGAKIESFSPYNAAEYTGRKFDRTVFAASSPTADDLWCFTYHSKKSGNTLVLFQPEERVLNALKPALPRLVQLDLNKKMIQK